MCIKQNAELYEEELFNYLYNSVDKTFFKKNSLSALSSRKSTTLNFIESVNLYLLAMADKKYNKYVIWALERMYNLSSDVRLNELILWNLATQYEKKSDFILASELYSLFKKLFPGSRFYWTARHKEIINSFKFCQHEYHDIAQVERTIKLCESYLVDLTDTNVDLDFEIVSIFQDLSLRMIKKTLNVGLHYLKKYSYTRENTTILSVLHRLNLLVGDIDYFSSYCQSDIEIKKNKLYEIVLREIKNNVEELFLRYDLVLPSGKNYLDENREIMEKIECNKVSLRSDLSFVCEEILFHIDAYYEL